jgi:hypothetical protein
MPKKRKKAQCAAAKTRSGGQFSAAEDTANRHTTQSTLTPVLAAALTKPDLYLCAELALFALPRGGHHNVGG